MSTSPAVIFRLALLVLLFPVYISLLRAISPAPGRRLLVAAFLAISVSFVASVFDAGATRPYAEAVTHLSVGVAGLLALAAVIRAKRLEVGRRGSP